MIQYLICTKRTWGSRLIQSFTIHINLQIAADIVLQIDFQLICLIKSTKQYTV